MHKCQLFCRNQGIYLNQYMKVQSINSFIFHNGGSCRTETSPLICSVNQWTGFCMIGTSIMKYSRRSSSTYNESLFLHVVKHDLLFLFLFFFYLGLLSRMFTIHRTAGEGGCYLPISFLLDPPVSQTLGH